MDDSKSNSKEPASSDANYRLKAGLFLATVTGISAVAAFASTLASAKKRDPEMFEKGSRITREFPETGVDLAMRALRRATVYSVTGCGLIAYGIWKLSGAENLHDFRVKMGNVLPRITRNDPPQSRTEFSGLNDLLNYLEKDYRKESSEGQSVNNSDMPETEESSESQDEEPTTDTQIETDSNIDSQIT